MVTAKKFFKVLNVFFEPLHNTRKFVGVNVDRDIIYDKTHEWGKADMVYTGEKTEKKPVFINIHGGGFVGGDKHSRDSIAQRFAELGYFVYNLNYRVVETHPFFVCTEDCVVAINFLNELSTIYNLDMDNITLSGDSAGAFLAFQVYISTINEEYRKKLNLPRCEVTFKKQVLYCGPYDAVKSLVKHTPFDLNRKIAEKACDMVFDKKFTNIAEYKYLDASNLLNWVPEKGFPMIPTFIVFSKIDYFCPGDGEKLLEMFKEREFPHQEFHAHRLIDNHCFHLMQFTKISKDCIAKMDKFIKEN